MSGYYELVCDVCNGSIKKSWVCAWCEDSSKPTPFATLHWGRCLELCKAVNEGEEVRHRGVPHFKLEMEPIFGEYVELVGDGDGNVVLRLRYARTSFEYL